MEDAFACNRNYVGDHGAYSYGEKRKQWNNGVEPCVLQSQNNQ